MFWMPLAILCRQGLPAKFILAVRVLRWGTGDAVRRPLPNSCPTRFRKNQARACTELEIGDVLRPRVNWISWGAAIMPSATYIDSALQTDTGQHAIERYIVDNTGRTVELIPEVIAETSQFVDHGSGGEEPSAVDTHTTKIYGLPLTEYTPSVMHEFLHNQKHVANTIGIL